MDTQWGRDRGTEAQWGRDQEDRHPEGQGPGEWTLKGTETREVGT